MTTLLQFRAQGVTLELKLTLETYLTQYYGTLGLLLIQIYSA